MAGVRACCVKHRATAGCFTSAVRSTASAVVPESLGVVIVALFLSPLTVEQVYGEPLERNGVSVLPVMRMAAKARCGTTSPRVVTGAMDSVWPRNRSAST